MRWISQTKELENGDTKIFPVQTASLMARLHLKTERLWAILILISQQDLISTSHTKTSIYPHLFIGKPVATLLTMYAIGQTSTLSKETGTREYCMTAGRQQTPMQSFQSWMLLTVEADR